MSQALKEVCRELLIRQAMLQERIYHLQERLEALDGIETPPLPLPQVEGKEEK